MWKSLIQQSVHACTCSSPTFVSSRVSVGPGRAFVACGGTVKSSNAFCLALGCTCTPIAAPDRHEQPACRRATTQRLQCRASNTDASKHKIVFLGTPEVRIKILVFRFHLLFRFCSGRACSITLCMLNMGELHGRWLPQYCNSCMRLLITTVPHSRYCTAIALHCPESNQSARKSCVTSSRLRFETFSAGPVSGTSLPDLIPI